MKGTLLEGIRWCLRACSEGNLVQVRFRVTDLVLEIFPERVDGAAMALLSVPNDEDLLRLVHLTLMEDFTRKGSVHEDARGGEVQILFLIPVCPAE